jgi:hypothetical protein
MILGIMACTIPHLGLSCVKVIAMRPQRWPEKEEEKVPNRKPGHWSRRG